MAFLQSLQREKAELETSAENEYSPVRSEQGLKGCVCSSHGELHNQKSMCGWGGEGLLT